MRNILFVDDEPHLLAGLEVSLRKLRSEWNMSFAVGSAAAVELLGKSPFDVVVTDLHMAGMDGHALLTHVKQHVPNAVRIILSGTAQRDSVVRSVGIAHQFVTKPCKPGDLRAVVRRALAMRDLLSNERLVQVASKLRSLPSLPALYVEIEEILTSGKGSIDDVGRLVAKDVAMSAKVLHVANSAFFGAARTFTSPVQATVYLGLGTITSLVLTTGIFSSQSELAPRVLESLWTHGMRIGAFARAIAKLEGLDPSIADQSFLAGLLHQVGLLVLAAELPDELAKAWKHARRFEMPLAEAERRVIGASRTAVGAYLMGIWGLPDPVVEAIAFQDAPAAIPHDQVSPVTTVHVARALDGKVGEVFGQSESVMDVEYLERLGVAGRIPAWSEHCRQIEGREAA